MGQKDSDLEITIGPLMVGLHPDLGEDVYLAIGDARGTMTRATWGDVAAMTYDDFGDPGAAARMVAKACGVELDDDAEDEVTSALRALHGYGDAAAIVHWHWGEQGIDAKATVGTKALTEASRLGAKACGAKVARLLSYERAGLCADAVLVRLGAQVRALAG